MTATEFRQKLYSVLLELSESGKSVTITHRNRSFRLEPIDRPNLLSRLIRHDTLRVPADDLVSGDDVLAHWNEGTYLDGAS